MTKNEKVLSARVPMKEYERCMKLMEKALGHAPMDKDLVLHSLSALNGELRILDDITIIDRLIAPVRVRLLVRENHRLEDVVYNLKTDVNNLKTSVDKRIQASTPVDKCIQASTPVDNCIQPYTPVNKEKLYTKEISELKNELSIEKKKIGGLKTLLERSISSISRLENHVSEKDRELSDTLEKGVGWKAAHDTVVADLKESNESNELLRRDLQQCKSELRDYEFIECPECKTEITNYTFTTECSACGKIIMFEPDDK